MNQFKPKFLGTNDPQDWLSDLKRAVNSQKCIRVGGKHNDLNDVGKDMTHHTFFEMLGSWSFGDYFKKEACEMSLKLLTEHYGLSIDRLYFTYFAGDATIQPDVTTLDIWRSLGVPESRILPFGTKDNFWEMGDTGPCGPCTEIHYDYSEKLRNVPELVNANSPDVVEIWNLVFMQFNRMSDRSLIELPSHHVDTGMGLERLTAILQNKNSNYDSDLFQPIIKGIEWICPNNAKYSGGISPIDEAYRTVADHLRLLVIAIGDNVYPGNTKEELIVRQVLRRAYLQSINQLKAPDYLLKTLCPVVVSTLGSHFTNLRQKESEIVKIIDQEVSSFSEILSKGESIFFSTLSKIKDSIFPMEKANLMHNHYGYPVEMLIETTKKHNLDFDITKFKQYQEERKSSKEKKLMTTQKRKQIPITSNIINCLRKSGVPVTDSSVKYDYTKSNATYTFPSTHSKLRAIINTDGVSETETKDGQCCALVFDKTCFYFTDGGQECDVGEIHGHKHAHFVVEAVTNCGGYVFHHGTGSGFKIGDEYNLRIDYDNRIGCMRAHTATHLLNSALRETLGEVSQHGSRVSSNEIRLTFLGRTPSHDDLKRIVNLVMSRIDEDLQVKVNIFSLKDALANPKIRRLEDFMYADPARIISIGRSTNSYSMELCGGTHVLTTQDVENFEIVTSKSQGKHKTTLHCLTSSRAAKCKENSKKLQSLVEKHLISSRKILSASESTIDDCEVTRKENGRVNYKVNQSQISAVMKAELKEKLRKHSQMLGSKIRNLNRRRSPIEL